MDTLYRLSLPLSYAVERTVYSRTSGPGDRGQVPHPASRRRPPQGNPVQPSVENDLNGIEIDAYTHQRLPVVPKHIYRGPPSIQFAPLPLDRLYRQKSAVNRVEGGCLSPPVQR